MTTGDCAKHLNALIGERVFNDRDILERVRARELVCVNPGRSRRARAKITALAFCAYIQAHHPELLPAAEKRLGLTMFHGEHSSRT